MDTPFIRKLCSPPPPPPSVCVIDRVSVCEWSTLLPCQAINYCYLYETVGEYKVTLLIYSGLPDPVWTIGSQNEKFQENKRASGQRKSQRQHLLLQKYPCCSWIQRFLSRTTRSTRRGTDSRQRNRGPAKAVAFTWTWGTLVRRGNMQRVIQPIMYTWSN